MKFGNHLASKIHEPWRSFYFDYNTIKLDMKQRQLEHGWNVSDENEFFAKIESELTKVYNFIDKGLKGLKNRVEKQQAFLDKLMSNPNASKKKYDIIADQLTEILFDTNDFAKFGQLNMTGFEKMLKKHDRYTQLDMTTRYRQQFGKTMSLEKLNLSFDVLIVKISDLHDICHLHGRPREQHLNNDQTAFERATAKYWIHPDHITEVKSIILFHLPVHVFNKNKQYEESDMAVSSVYYDNDKLDLYKERSARSEGAEAIRLRWYGPSKDENDDIYVERKTHKASWLDGKSVKDRFRLRESQVNAYTAGKLTADQIAEEVRQKNKNKKEVDTLVKETHFIASGVQKSIKQRKLQPKVRVFYNRTAFQLPGNQLLRISLDCNLTFIKEEGRERVSSKQLNWRRNDIGIDYPFHSVAEKDISRFPYAILETKLQTHLGQKAPAWLTNLIKSHLVHEVPRFSKYVHGAAMLFPDQVPITPHWLPTFDQDIRTSPTTEMGLSRSMSFKPLVNGHHRQSLMMMYERELKENKSKSTGDLFSRNTENSNHVAINLFDNSGNNERQQPRNLVNRLWTASAPTSAPRVPADQVGSPVVFPERRNNNNNNNNNVKKVKKIEPKTFFANERTFISWLQFCALILTVALSLLNNGDHISRIVGATFLIISSCICCYALFRYQWRAYHLRTQESIIRYDDIWGPTVLCGVLLIALIVNFYLRLETLSPAYFETLEAASTDDSLLKK